MTCWRYLPKPAPCVCVCTSVVDVLWSVFPTSQMMLGLSYVGPSLAPLPPSLSTNHPLLPSNCHRLCHILWCGSRRLAVRIWWVYCALENNRSKSQNTRQIKMLDYTSGEDDRVIVRWIAGMSNDLSVRRSRIIFESEWRMSDEHVNVQYSSYHLPKK